MDTKRKLRLCLALVLSGCIFGCSTTKPVFADHNADIGHNPLPIKFAGYREFFTFVGTNSNNGMPINNDTLFKLAAESQVEIITVDFPQMPYLYVVKTHYFRNGFDTNHVFNFVYDEIRGAQGNGQFYILRPLATTNAALGGFELLGILNGNAYTVQHLNGTPRFVSYWHLSAGEHPESIYEWNGKFFEPKNDKP